MEQLNNEEERVIKYDIKHYEVNLNILEDYFYQTKNSTLKDFYYEKYISKLEEYKNYLELNNEERDITNFEMNANNMKNSLGNSLELKIK